jgi:hypothetical protein
MGILALFSGYKTYLAATGLLGLSVYQVSQGQYEMSYQSFMAALTAFGLRHAIAKQAGGTEVGS